PEEPLPPAGHLPQHQHRLQAAPPDEGHRRAVRREARCQRSTRTADRRLLLPRLPVDALDDVDHSVRVAVVLETPAGADVLAEVDVAAVGGDDRLRGVLFPVAALGDLRPRAAGDVVEPHLAGTEGAGVAEVLTAHQVLTVRGPRGVADLALLLARYLAQAVPVGVH